MDLSGEAEEGDEEGSKGDLDNLLLFPVLVKLSDEEEDDEVDADGDVVVVVEEEGDDDDDDDDDDDEGVSTPRTRVLSSARAA